MSAAPKDLPIQDPTPRELAQAGWGPELPDWIAALVAAREAHSQNDLAKRLGFSPSALGRAIRNTYPSPLTNIEAAVRRILMQELIPCPELGEITPRTCEAWAAKSSTYVGSNRFRGLMARACQSCPLKPRAR